MAEVLKVLNASSGDFKTVFDLITGKALELCDAPRRALITYDGTFAASLSPRNLSPTFADVGPRIFGGTVVPFRLDRCLAHGVQCLLAGTLDFGPSDHKPIVLELQIATAAVKRHPLQRARRSLAKIRAALR